MRGRFRARSSDRRSIFGSGKASWALSALLFCFVWTAPARAQPPAISLTGCAKISKAGLYNLDSLPVTGGLGDCIIISAANVVLNLNGATITGTTSGSGAGIHVTPSAGNVFIEGRGAVISGFTDGIEIDSAKSAAENFTVTANSDAGLFLKSASQATISNFNADSNSLDGVRISKGSYNTIGGAVRATANGRYGVWLLSTSHNNVGGFFVEDNAIAGVYIGCSPTGPLGSSCKPSAPVGYYNSIFNGVVQASSGAPPTQIYGVALDTGDDSNRVTNILSKSPYEKFDLDDENIDCARNAWFAQQLIFSSNPTSCIH